MNVHVWVLVLGVYFYNDITKEALQGVAWCHSLLADSSSTGMTNDNLLLLLYAIGLYAYTDGAPSSIPIYGTPCSSPILSLCVFR